MLGRGEGSGVDKRIGGRVGEREDGGEIGGIVGDLEGFAVRNREGLGVDNIVDFEVGVRVLGFIGFTEGEGFILDVGKGFFEIDGVPTTVGFMTEGFIGVLVDINGARIKIVSLDFGSISSFDKPSNPIILIMRKEM